MEAPMEYTITGKSPDKLEKIIAQYKKLTALKDDLAQRLEKARSQKESVSPKIYEKVISDYSSKLESVRGQLAPVESELDRDKKECEVELPQLKEQIRRLEEELDEAEFRFRVGEFDQNKLTEIQTRLNPELEEKKERQADFTERLAAINEGLNSVASPDGAAKSSPKDDAGKEEKRSTDKPSDAGAGKKHHTDEADDAGASHQTGADDGSSSRVTLSVEDPLDALTDEPRGKAAAESKADGPSDLDAESDEEDEDNSFENPQAWIDELGDGKEKAPSKKAPSKQADTKTDGKSDDDPLSALADPSGDPGDGNDRPAKADEPSPREEGSVGFPNMVILTGSSSGKKIPLLPMTMSIGREHDNNIELKDPDVGRYHARILFDRGRFILEDLESSNGTWLNGEKISEAALKNGDRVKIGETEFAIDFD
jgi:hypothetical protein